MFDARAYYATLERPVFIAPDGTHHYGRILGTDSWARIQTKLRLTKGQDGMFNPNGLASAMAHICDQMFPPNRWKPWQKTVKDWVFELPEIGRYRAVWDFMRSQAKSRGETMPETPGTLSTPMLPLGKQDGLSDVPPTPSSS